MALDAIMGVEDAIRVWLVLDVCCSDAPLRAMLVDLVASPV